MMQAFIRLYKGYRRIGYSRLLALKYAHRAWNWGY